MIVLTQKKKRFVPGGRVSIYIPHSVPPEIIKWLNLQSEISPAILHVIADYILRNGIKQISQKKDSITLSEFISGAKLSTLPSTTNTNEQTIEQTHEDEEKEIMQSEPVQIKTAEGFWKGTELDDEDGFM